MLSKHIESVDVNMLYKTVRFSVQCQRRSEVYGTHHRGCTTTLAHHESLWKEERHGNERKLNEKEKK
jgi:hypothetical protein